MKLDSKTVAALDLGGKADVIHFDDNLTGFGYRLRAGAGGKVLRSWLVQYRRAGATRRLLLGPGNVLSAEAARAAAKKALAKVALDEDPQGDRAERRSRERLTRFVDLVEEYLQVKQTEVRWNTFRNVKRYLTGSYFKPLHAMPVDAITRRDIAARLVVITRENGNVAAVRARTSLNTFFVWAMQMGLAESNPVIGSIQPKDCEIGTHVLTDIEIAAV
jgi:hypothetical protein